jgi:hypothetical protein
MFAEANHSKRILGHKSKNKPTKRQKTKIDLYLRLNTKPWHKNQAYQEEHVIFLQ